MCFALRKTDMRGRSSVPFIRFRMRNLRLSRPTIRIAMANLLLAPEFLLLGALGRFTGLLAHLLVLVPHAFAAVGLRWTERANLRCGLPDRFLVGAREDED